MVDVVAVVVVEVDHRRHRVEQRQDRGVADQRDLVAGDLDRHPGRPEGAAQRRDRRTARPDQHGHVVPRDAVFEVGAAQQVGEVLGLGAVGVEGADGDPAVAQVAGLGIRLEEGGLGLRRDAAGEGQSGRDPLGGQEQVGAEPARGAQRHDVGGTAVEVGERAREVEDAAHLGPPEAVDGLVGVAHDREVAPVAGQLAQQRDLAGVGVLVLVDEDVGVAGPQLVAVLGGLEHRTTDQVGVVGGAVVVEVLEVLLEEEPGRRQLGQPVLEPEVAQLGAVKALLARPGQHGVDLAGEAAGVERGGQPVGPDHGLGVGGEQLAQHDVLLGGREQPQRGGVQLGRGVATDEPVGEGVERRAQARGHRAPESRGHPVAELLGRLAREGQGQDRLGRDPLVDPPHDGLDQRRGLAGAGARQHQQRPAGVVDHPLLVLVERRHLARDRALRTHQVVRRLRGRRGHGNTSSRATDSAATPGRRSPRPGRHRRDPGGRRRRRRRRRGRR